LGRGSALTAEEGTAPMNQPEIVFLRAWLETRFLAREDGAGLVEYSLLVVGIAALAVAAIGFFGGKVRQKYSSTGSSLP